MRKVHALLACSLLFCGSLVAEAQGLRTPKPVRQSNLAAAEREVREFYDSYADDLRRHRRSSIADRYDPRGAFFLGNGGKTLETFEAIKNSYLTKWRGPQSFGWKDMSFEILSPGAAVVVGRFEWQTDKGETLTYSYTGLLVRRTGGWRIRVEDESRQPAKCPGQ